MVKTAAPTLDGRKIIEPSVSEWKTILLRLTVGTQCATLANVMNFLHLGGRMRYVRMQVKQVNRSLVVMLLSCCTLTFIGHMHAATLYVDTTNPSASDSNSGTQSQPWKSIQKAASAALAGDNVIVKAGVYNEYITNKQSGTAGSPITFIGERGTNGEWLTIIDPSTPITNGWVAAPEFGFGVWKQTNMSFITKELTIDHKRVAFVYTNGLLPEISEAYQSSGLSRGMEFLTLPASSILTNKMSGKAVTFWAGVKALYVTVSNTTFLRLTDGSQPNGMNVRAAPNPTVVRSDMASPAFKIIGKSYITIRNCMIRGAFGGFFVEGATAHHIVIESNSISGGYARVVLGTAAHENVVRNNEMTANYYGYDNPGAWEDGVGTNCVIREQLYLNAKYLMGQSTSFDADVKFVNAGNSNVISGNHIFKGLGEAVGISGNIYSPSKDTEVFDNSIENEPSIGIALGIGHTGTKVHNNRISDCNLNLRFHQMDNDNETNRVVYIYRNRLWLPADTGNHIYVHLNNSAPAVYHPTYWTYHNSFSGGSAGLTLSSYVVGNGGITNTHFINNVFSGTVYLGDAFWGIMTNRYVLGTFDYNLITPPYPTYPTTKAPDWYGAHNNKAVAAEWSTNAMQEFKLSAGSLAIDAAIDVSKPFVIQGVSYPALPVGAEQMTGSAWEVGAVEYAADGRSALPPPTELRIASIWN